MDKNKFKTKAIEIKNHLLRNKVAYAASAVAIGAVALQVKRGSAFKEFLVSKGIDPDEFLNPEMLEEMQ